MQPMGSHAAVQPGEEYLEAAWHLVARDRGVRPRRVTPVEVIGAAAAAPLAGDTQVHAGARGQTEGRRLVGQLERVDGGVVVVLTLGK